MPVSKRVIIIGGGVIGLCCAYYAMRNGHAVTVLERGTLDYDCCSKGNAGMIVPSHFVPLAAPGMISYGLKMLGDPKSPFALKPGLNGEFVRWCLLFAMSSNKTHVERAGPLLRDLNTASRCAYEDLGCDLGGNFGLSTNGLLMLVKSKHALEEEIVVARRANSLGITAEVLSAPEIAVLEPGVDMDIAGGVYYPKDAHLTPQNLVSSLTMALLDNGVEILTGVDALSFSASRGRLQAVCTTKGDFIADDYVLAAGSWSAKLLKSINVALPLLPGKGYSFTLQSPRQLPKICSILLEARLAVTPMGSALRVGGTMELGEYDHSINKNRVDGMKSALPTYFPEFKSADFDDVPAWSGLRPCSPDGLPYIGRIGGFNNLVAATGHAMMGVSLGPITGQLIASILSETAPKMNIAMLSPDRFKRN